MNPAKKGMLVGAGLFAILFTITALNVSKSDILQLLIVQIIICSVIGSIVWIMSRERKACTAGKNDNACDNVIIAESRDDRSLKLIDEGNSAVQQEDDETTQPYKAAIGERNQNYYLSRFRKFDREPGNQVSWNWAAFILPAFWLLYRKMYGLWALLVAGFILTIVKPDLLILNALGVSILALFADSRYHRHIRAMIAEAESKQLKGDQLLNYLKQNGDVNKWVFIAAIAAFAVIFIFAIV